MILYQFSLFTSINYNDFINQSSWSDVQSNQRDAFGYASTFFTIFTSLKPFILLLILKVIIFINRDGSMDDEQREREFTELISHSQ